MSLRLDPAKLDRELARRGISQRQFAERCGLHETAISRARREPVREATLRRITEGLLAIPLMPGADLLVAEPTTKKAAGGSTSPAAQEVVSRGRGRASG